MRPAGTSKGLDVSGYSGTAHSYFKTLVSTKDVTKGRHLSFRTANTVERSGGLTNSRVRVNFNLDAQPKPCLYRSSRRSDAVKEFAKSLVEELEVRDVS